MRITHFLISVLGVLLSTFPALAQPITYQGRLTQSLTPVSGWVDLRFRLYRSATGTQQVGPQVLALGTPIQDGTFTTTFDFGPVFTSDEERWLEIDVRQSGTSYTTLSPRQRITAAPLAHSVAGLTFTRAGEQALDQAQDVVDSIYANVHNITSWQSFTPSRSGTLDRVELFLGGLGNVGALTVTLRAGVGTNGAAIATYTLPPAQDGIISVPFPNAVVLAGNPYTLVFTSSANVLLRTTVNRIPGATAFWAGNLPDCNWFFRTYITPAATVHAVANQALSTTFAYQAQNVPWSGLTGQAEVSTPAIGTGWQMFLTNRSNNTARGGLRLSDAGAIEVSSTANLANPIFTRLTALGVWTTVSDRRLKTDIHAAEGNLAAALKLQPVNFRWKSTGQSDTGLIAQDVRDVLPHLVTGDESKENLTVNYSQLSVVAIGAIQEQQQKIETLEQRLHDLESQLARMQQLLGAP